MKDKILNFDDKTYWDEKSRQFPSCGIGLESIEETDEIWLYFKYCLQTQNRFFFNHPLKSIIIKHFEDHVFTLSKDTKIYRARIDQERRLENQCWLARDYNEFHSVKPDSQFVDFYKEAIGRIAENPEYQEFLVRQLQGFEGFDAQGSGAPSYEKVSAGRCNPEHTVFLYTANDKHTATAEVRPYIRDAVSIATLSVQKDLRLVDFYYEFNKDGFRNIDNVFFDKIRQEFSLLNKGNKDDYLITQYLSLLAEHQGFDGIRFRSSLVEKGINYVIFNPDNCVAISSEMYILRKVEYNLVPIIPKDKLEVTE